MNDKQQNDRKLLGAAELLLSDVRRQREELDRREADLREQVAAYRARLGLPESPSLFEHANGATEGDGGAEGHEETTREHGAITRMVLQILRDSNKWMAVQKVGVALKSRGAPITAGDPSDAARYALRRLVKQKKARTNGQGYYRARNIEETPATPESPQ